MAGSCPGQRRAVSGVCPGGALGAAGSRGACCGSLFVSNAVTTEIFFN